MELPTEQRGLVCPKCEGQMETLTSIGTTLMQGYYFGRPLCVDEFLARLAEPAIPRDKPR